MAQQQTILSLELRNERKTDTEEGEVWWENGAISDDQHESKQGWYQGNCN